MLRVGVVLTSETSAIDTSHRNGAFVESVEVFKRSYSHPDRFESTYTWYKVKVYCLEGGVGKIKLSGKCII